VREDFTSLWKREVRRDFLETNPPSPLFQRGENLRRGNEMIEPVGGIHPEIDPSAFVASNATVLGKVKIGAESGVWFGAVIRGDSNSIQVGARTNIQDVSVLHVDRQHAMVIGDDVTIGHRALLHGCTIADSALIGMGAIIMNGAKIGSESIVAAGALVTENTEVPARSLLMGQPAKVKRTLTDEEVEGIRANARHYVKNRLLYQSKI